MIDPQRILDAQTLLARHFGPTRIVRAASLSSAGHDVYLKLETDLPTGSFKVRGAVYSLSRKLANAKVGEVVAASTGNHGAAVAYAAQLLGVSATIFLPINPNPVKAARIRALGARIEETSVDLSAAIDAARAYTERTGAFFLHDATDPDIPAGTATIGMEIVSQVPAVDVIYVPMGDTALIRGVASAAKQRRPSIAIVGVVAEQAPAYYLSWQQGTPVETESANTIADGLAVRRPLAPNVAAIRELVDEVVVVSEEAMRAAIEQLQAREHVTAEPAGAAATAAFLKRGDTNGGRVLSAFANASADRRSFSGGRSDPAARTTVLLVTGSNIAPGLLRSRPAAG